IGMPYIYFAGATPRNQKMGGYFDPLYSPPGYIVPTTLLADQNKNTYMTQTVFLLDQFNKTEAVSPLFNPASTTGPWPPANGGDPKQFIYNCQQPSSFQ